MQTVKKIIPLVLLISAYANAITVTAKNGNTYDVQMGAPFSPLAALMSFQSTVNKKSTQEFEIKELRYKTQISTARISEIREEAIDVFNSYYNLTNNDYKQEFYDAIKQHRIIQTLILAGSGTPKIDVMGNNNGRYFEKRSTPNYYFAVFNPAGQQFSHINFDTTEYWVKEKNNSYQLKFLAENINPEKENTFLQEVLGVGETNKWIAFSVTKTRKESVDLTISVFNHESLIRKEEIYGVIRENLWDSSTINSYSIHPQNNNSIICFKTNSGIVEYDGIKNIITNQNTDNTNPSQCF